MPQFDLYSQEFKRNAYATYAAMRDLDPVMQHPGMTGAPIWFVTGYQQATAVLRDHKRFVKDWRSLQSAEQRAQQPSNPIADYLDNHLLAIDPPDHSRVRALVNKAFTARRVNAMRPRIQAIADRLLDKMVEANSADLIDAFAFPLPITVIAELLGVPAEDQDRFRLWSNAVIAPAPTEEAWMKKVPLLMQFIEYLGDTIQARRKHPSDDLISALVQVEEAGDKLNASELYSMVFLLLVAGHETTVNLIANSILALLQHPDLYARLQTNPDQIPTALEELLRYDAPVERALARWVAEDIEFSGHSMKRGDPVLVVIGAANRDPAQFVCPTQLDLDRSDNKHIAFGLGIHYCLGAPLARLEGEIALTSLLTRLPNLRLTVPYDALRWREVTIVRGLEQFPVAWGPQDSA